MSTQTRRVKQWEQAYAADLRSMLGGRDVRGVRLRKTIAALTAVLLAPVFAVVRFDALRSMSAGIAS